MTPEQNKAIVTRFNKEVIEGKKINIASGFFTDDFINHAAPPGAPNNAEGMILFLQNILWKSLSDISVEILDQIAEEDRVVTRKTIHGLHIGEFLGQPASHKKIKINIIDIVRLRDGRYAEHWRMWDPQSIIAQIKG